MTDYLQEIIEDDLDIEGPLAENYKDLIVSSMNTENYDSLEEFYEEEVQSVEHQDVEADEVVHEWSPYRIRKGRRLNCLGKALKTAFAAEQFPEDVYPVIQYNDGFENGHVGVVTEEGAHGMKPEKEGFEVIKDPAGYYLLHLSSKGFKQVNGNLESDVRETAHEMARLMYENDIDSEYLDRRIDEAFSSSDENHKSKEGKIEGLESDKGLI